MRRFPTFGVLVAAAAILFAQESTNQAQTDAPGWTEQAVTPDAAQAFLEGILHGEKHAVIKGTIADTSEKDVNLGTTCRSNSSGTVEGNVNDNGDVSGQVRTNGSTSCSEQHNYFYWMTVAYVDRPSSGLIITARCDVRWVWNHCVLPVAGAADPMVIAREKKGHYTVYISLRNGSLDKKGTVSKYEIVDLKHFTK